MNPRVTRPTEFDKPVLSGPSGLTGTMLLLRLALRRDRALILASTIGLVLLAVGSAQATLALYPTPETVSGGLGPMLSNPALLAMYGPITNPTSPDAFAVYKTTMMGAVMLSLVSFLIVRRHTRSEEEDGQLELLGSTVVGRRAPLTTAVLLALGTVVLICALTVTGMLILGMEPAGTFAFGVSWFSAGVVMAAITAVAAQLASTARGCSAISISVLGLAFLTRAAADAVAGASWLQWLSFLGWSERVQPYGGNRFSSSLLSIAVAVALLLLAYRVRDRRDLGAGLLPSRPGPDRASGSLNSALGLAWRLQRWSLLGWTVAFVMIGALVGSIAGSIEQLMSDPATADLMRQLGGTGSLQEIFFSAEFSFAGFLAAAYGISATLRLRGEERRTHAESLLATATSRRTWLSSHLVIALAGAAWLLFVVGLSAGLIHGVAVSDVAGTVPTLVGAAMVSLPAVWICIGLTVLIFGVAPRWTSAAWVALIAFLILGEFGPLFDVPSWLRDLSPFAHLPALPGGAFTSEPLVAMTVAAALLIAWGSWSFRRRDIG